MPVYETTVTDSSNVPVAGAKGYIYVNGVLAELTDDLGAPLGNPITSDALGYAKATVPNRDFTVKWSWQGTIRMIETYIEGGVDSTIRTDLAADTGAALIGTAGGGTVQDAVGVKSQRLRALHLLQDSMGRAGMAPPDLAADLPTIGAQLTSSAIVTGTLWQLSDVATPEIHADKYTFVGGEWARIGTSFPNSEIWKGLVARGGSASDPSLDPRYAGRVRFALDAPDFEIKVQIAGSGTGDGFRLKVLGADGRMHYVSTGTTFSTGTNGTVRFIPVTWGDGSPAHRKTRFYELEFGTVGGFMGVRTTNLYKPQPWPQPDGLRVLLHGDSLPMTISDSGDKDASLLPQFGQGLGDVLGQSDTIISGVGGSGWLAPAVKDRSYFNDRVALDVVAPAPDVVIEIGGGNDAVIAPTEAAYQALVETWLSAVLTAKPETVVFMTSPVIASAPGANHLVLAAAKAAAAANWPQNVAFIDLYTDPVVFGTGRLGATAGNGNRDWVTGTDGSHLSIEGHAFYARRLAAAIAGAIPGLIAANS